MNQFIKSISDLDKKVDLKKQKLKEIKLQEQKEQENLQEQERQEEDVKEEIKSVTSIKYILENYKKIYWGYVKSNGVAFFGVELIGILVYYITTTIFLNISPVNQLPITGVIFYNLCAVILFCGWVLADAKEIREIKKNYKLEEVIEESEKKEKELEKINEKKEEIKETLNQLNIQISNLENQLENIRIKHSQEISDYEWVIKKVTKKDKIEMYTKEIQKLCDRRKNEMNVLINDEFEQREKSNGLTLKRQK